jgi:hypothetical protein
MGELLIDGIPNLTCSRCWAWYKKVNGRTHPDFSGGLICEHCFAFLEKKRNPVMPKLMCQCSEITGGNCKEFVVSDMVVVDHVSLPDFLVKKASVPMSHEDWPSNGANRYIMSKICAEKLKNKSGELVLVTPLKTVFAHRVKWHDWLACMSEDGRVVRRQAKNFESLKDMHAKLGCPFNWSDLRVWSGSSIHGETISEKKRLEIERWFEIDNQK